MLVRELIFDISATNLGSFGIQFPITIPPPATRTTSLATSDGFAASVTPEILITERPHFSLVAHLPTCSLTTQPDSNTTTPIF